MENIVINMAGVDLTFAVTVHEDYDTGAPWENNDGHGPVSDWTGRDKKPGELVLCSGGMNRYYDFQEACKIALREGWDAYPFNDVSQTKRQQATKAALADYEYLRSWCKEEWSYVGIKVTLLDSKGQPTEVTESLWSVEDRDNNVEIEAKTIAEELAHGLHTRFEIVTETVTTFKLI